MKFLVNLPCVIFDTSFRIPIILNYNWTFGSSAGTRLVIQILSGISLAIHYIPHIDYAFSSEVGKSVVFWLWGGFSVDSCSCMCIVFNLKKRLKDIFASYKANSHYYNYLGAFLLLLTFTFVWGILFKESLLFLLLGLCPTLVAFKALMSIRYPEGLKACKSLDNSFLSFCSVTKSERKLLLVLLGFLLVNLFLPNLVPYLLIMGTDKVSVYIIQQPYLVLYSCFSAALSVLVGAILYKKEGIGTPSKKVSYPIKKLYTFYRKYPTVKKNKFVLLLTGMTYLVNKPFLFYGFIGFSLRNNCGFHAYCFFVFSLILTLVVTLPCFRIWFFKSYSKNSLRIIGWNSPAITGAKIGAAIAIGGTTMLGVHLLNGSASRLNDVAHDAHEDARIEKHNHQIDLMRMRDPQGRDNGKYGYVDKPFRPATKTSWEPFTTPTVWPKWLKKK